MRISKYLVLLGLVFLLATHTYARKINMKINLAGNAVDGFSAEEEFLQLGEEAVKTSFHGDIKGTGNDLNVFQTQRFSREEDLVIHIPVPDGVYSVTLMFAETWNGAFQPGKRVFDVYLGSKPGGVLKVAQNFDPFRAGGPAGPVRKKYNGIATQGGLTVALRPIKQNPQIAGIVVSGFSYSEALLDELPTIAAEGSPSQDFSVLSTIGPRLPVDPLMIYDPNLNPKLTETTAAGVNRPSSTTSSHQTNLLTGRTPGYIAHNHVSSPGLAYGPGASPLSSAIDSGHSSVNSPTSQSGNGLNSFSGRPSPQFRTPIGNSPRLSSPAGTVRLALTNAGPSHRSSYGNGKLLPEHELEFRKPQISVHSSHHRHGRHLSSIPAEIEAKAQTIGPASSESIPSNQNSIPLPTQEWRSSNYPSEPSHPSSSATTYPNHSTKSQLGEKIEKETFKNEHTGGYVGAMGGITNWVPNQHELNIGKTNPNMQNLNRGENEHILHQAQAESLMSSYPSSPLSRARPEPTNLGSNSQSSATSKSNDIQVTSTSDLANPVVHESSSHAQHQISFPIVPGSQEPARQNSLSYSDSASPVASSRFQKFDPQPEDMEARNAVKPLIETEEKTLQTNNMGRVRGAKDLEPVSGTSEFEYQKEIPRQTIFETDDFQNSRTPEKVEHDTHSPRTLESLSSTFSQPSGMKAVHASSTVASPVSMRDERNNAMDGPSGFINTATVGSTEPARQPVRASVQNLGDPSTSASAFGGPTTEAGGNENYQGISSRSIMSKSTEQLSARADSPRFGSKDEAGGNESYRAISSRPMTSASKEQLTERADSTRFESADPRLESMRFLNNPSPGVHNGNGVLDGLCIDNSTHCSCGMVEQIADASEECLFVIDENTSPMLCVTRPCSGKVVCACAPGANTLCHRSAVKSILVRAPTSSLETTEDPTVVTCKREILEEGILILTPII